MIISLNKEGSLCLELIEQGRVARVRVRVGEEDLAVPVWLLVVAAVSAVVSVSGVVSEPAVA